MEGEALVPKLAVTYEDSQGMSKTISVLSKFHQKYSIIYSYLYYCKRVSSVARFNPTNNITK